MNEALHKLLAECVKRRTDAELGAQAAAGSSLMMEQRCKAKIEAYTWMGRELDKILKSHDQEEDRF